MKSELLASAERWLAAFRPSIGKGLLIAFVLGFVVRVIPEILSHPYPIGFDTVYYAWRIKEGVIWAHWSNVFSSWLLYALLTPLYAALRIEPFLVLKLAMPLLFGLNACGVYYLAVNGLNWSARKGLFAAGLFSFQLAALRISSDLYRNMLGLGVLLFAVPWILREKADSRSLVVLGILSLLAVFSHEYVSVLLLASVLGFAVSNGLKGERAKALKVFGAALPALTVFVVSIFLRTYPIYRAAEPNILTAYQASGQYSGPLSFVTNYLAVSGTASSYVSCLGLFASVSSLFAVLYVAILPLAIVGFFGNRVLDTWAVCLCVGAFGCLVAPFFALENWDRWMMMLIFPLTFYATNGFLRVLQSTKPVGAALWRFGSFMISKRVAKGLVLTSVTMGFAFMTSPMFFGKGGVYGLPTTVTYLPSTILASTIPLCDVEGTVEALRWVDAAMDENSCFLAHSAFLYWARFCFDEQHTIVSFRDNVYGAIELGAEHGFWRFWLVWWNEDIGWYGSQVPEDFMRVFSSGRISVFEYVRT